MTDTAQQRNGRTLAEQRTRVDEHPKLDEK